MEKSSCRLGGGFVGEGERDAFWTDFDGDDSIPGSLRGVPPILIFRGETDRGMLLRTFAALLLTSNVSSPPFQCSSNSYKGILHSVHPSHSHIITVRLPRERKDDAHHSKFPSSDHQYRSHRCFHDLRRLYL